MNLKKDSDPETDDHLKQLLQITVGCQQVKEDKEFKQESVLREKFRDQIIDH